MRKRPGSWRRGHVLALVLGALALGGVLFACGSDAAPPPCEGAACVDGAADAPPADGAAEGRVDADGAADAANDAVDASDGSAACPGPAGTLDPTFGDGGLVVLPFPGGDGRAAAVQPDGKIVVAGKTTGAGAGAFAVARLMPNGSLDTTFGTEGVTETVVGNTVHSLSALVLQPDGKILAAGHTRIVGDDFAVLRYLANGALDATFGTGGVVLTDFSSADNARAMVLMADGRLVVAGATLAGTGNMAFARYNPDGSLDTTFGGTGMVTIDIRGTADQARGLALQPGGKVLAVGTSRDPAEGRTDMAAVRLNEDGSLDTTFATAGKLLTDFGGPGSQAMNGLAIDGAGRAVAAGLYGSASPDDFGTLRFTASGTPDPTFGDAGLVRTDFSLRSDNAQAALCEPGGNVLVAGSSLSAVATDARVAIARHLSGGGLDPSFGTAGRASTALPSGFSGAGVAQAAVLATCSVVVIGGWVDDGAGGVPRIGVVRFRR
jgi:uncharacterized delta-60 repeat protein